MYFSAKEAYTAANDNDTYLARSVRSTLNYVLGRAPDQQVSLKDATTVMKTVRSALMNRADTLTIHRLNLGKWLRPWDVVPHIINFTPPEGDFGIGIEIEHGFASAEDASYIASKIIDWKYTAIDMEGGTYPLEVTFAPSLYSKFDNRTQPMRYLNLLSKNRQRLAGHRGAVGTHVNVSCSRPVAAGAIYNMTSILSGLGGSAKLKYFSRNPYGYLYQLHHHVEYKLFNSKADPEELVKYVEVAVAIHKMITTSSSFTTEEVVAALDAAVLLAAKKNKARRRGKKAANVSSPV